MQSGSRTEKRLLILLLTTCYEEAFQIMDGNMIPNDISAHRVCFQVSGEDKASVVGSGLLDPKMIQSEHSVAPDCPQ